MAKGIERDPAHHPVDPDENIAALRAAFRRAEAALLVYVMEICPGGKHNPVQHRDRKPPWCRACGRTATGVLIETPRGDTDASQG